MMTERTFEIEVLGPSYGSQLDEDAFYWWLGKIPGVISCGGRRDLILIAIDLNLFDDQSFREIISIFFRYRIDMRSLLRFVNKKNRRWVLKPTAYWHGDLLSAGVREDASGPSE